mmetsp:Transcript_4439/g.18876  ORF Transcript_4439/g.18876 Transcript_4439/m.18876 type:complete len:218 (+) Transcript_4439:1500-2153(+)
MRLRRPPGPGRISGQARQRGGTSPGPGRGAHRPQCGSVTGSGQSATSRRAARGAARLRRGAQPATARRARPAAWLAAPPRRGLDVPKWCGGSATAAPPRQRGRRGSSGPCPPCPLGSSTASTPETWQSWWHRCRARGTAWTGSSSRRSACSSLWSPRAWRKMQAGCLAGRPTPALRAGGPSRRPGLPGLRAGRPASPRFALPLPQARSQMATPRSRL